MAFETNEHNQRLLKMWEAHTHEMIAERIQRLSDLADRLKRKHAQEADRGTPTLQILYDLLHDLSHGYANIDFPGVLLQASTVENARQSFMREDLKEVRAAVDTWEASGDDEALVNNVIDPFLNLYMTKEA